MHPPFHNTPENMSFAHDKFMAAHHSILNSLAEQIVLLDSNLKITWANNAALNERGISLDKVKGKFCHDAFFGQSAVCDSCKAKQALENGIPCASTILRPDNTRHVIRYIPLLDATKKAYGLAEIQFPSFSQQLGTETFYKQYRINAVRADIWKRAADKSVDEYDLIKQLLSILGEFLAISRASYFEEKNGVIECKEQWCAQEVTSYLGAILPDDMRDAVTNRIDSDVLCLDRDTLARKNVSGFADYFDAHGIVSMLVVQFSQTPPALFSFTDNSSRQWDKDEISLIQETTKIVSMRADHIRIEHENANLEDQLRHTQTLEAIGQLAGGVAHDFNNILGAISGYAEMIHKRTEQSDAKIAKYSSAILAGADKGAILTNQLLAFARRGRIRKSNIDIHAVLNSAQLLLQHTLDRTITIQFQFGATNPNIIGDSTQLQNIVLNLAMNGRDAMPGGGRLTIVTSNGNPPPALYKSPVTVQPDSFVIITVTDTGTGMDEVTKSRLFEPFFTTKDIGKGVGLGLASVYGSVKSHNGYISVESAVGKGTTVAIFLPVDKTVIRQDTLKKPVALAAGTRSIMIVENDDPVRAVCCEMLTSLGYFVTDFSNARDAIEYYRTHAALVHLVITDMIMDTMSGIDCFTELKKINPQVKTILASGYSFESDQQELSKMGIRGFIQKPYNCMQLSQTVTAIMQDL